MAKMDDIELTRKIASLKWEVNLGAGTVESELVRYRIVPGDGHTDLAATWISPDMPSATGVINEIQRGATAALRRAEQGR
jgi:hypothetical protein